LLRPLVELGFGHRATSVLVALAGGFAAPFAALGVAQRRLFLLRALRVRRSGLAKADGDRLVAALDLLAGAGRKLAFLELVHHAFHDVALCRGFPGHDPTPLVGIKTNGEEWRFRGERDERSASRSG